MANRNDVNNRNMLRRMGHSKAGMTRKEWLQKAGLAAAGVGAAAVGLGGIGRATGIVNPETGYYELEPVGVSDADYPHPLIGQLPPQVLPPDTHVTQDVFNVQLAVLGLEFLPGNQFPTPIPGFSGKVLLKEGEPFSFGDESEGSSRGYVFLTSDIEIKGVKDPVGNHLTKIEGGEDTFVSIAHIDVAIQDIWFNNARAGCITLLSASDILVSGNKITNVRPYQNLAPPDFGRGIGIYIGNNPALPTGPLDGYAKVENNYIDLNVDGELDDEVANTLAIGVYVSLSDAEIAISHNEIYNTGHAGILINDNRGPVDITDNTINTGGDIGYTPSTGFAPQGITAGNLLLPPDQLETTFIQKNKVTCDHPKATGIFIGGSTKHKAIENEVHMKDGFTALLWADWAGDLTGSRMLQNKVTGTADYLLAVSYHLDVGVAEHPNFVLENNTVVLVKEEDAIGFTSRVCDIALPEGANYNQIVLGSLDFVTVSDEGTGNKVLGKGRNVQMSSTNHQKKQEVEAILADNQEKLKTVIENILGD